MTWFLTDYLSLFQNLILPGFVYLVGIIFLIEAYTQFKVWESIKDYKDFSLYIGVFVLFLSFIVGLIIYLAEQELKSIIFSKYNFGKPKLGVDPKRYNNIYGVLIMLRHLIISVSLLLVSMSINFKKKRKNL